ncbi:hypothetical protein ACH5RR_010039 [Cinchona calisaya]|uniref:Uncharacterized protein n=1 Tax=Cinchona calisaya TaxID=153742 RepID=A0ABD3AI89_9GENT
MVDQSHVSSQRGNFCHAVVHYLLTWCLQGMTMLNGGAELAFLRISLPLFLLKLLVFYHWRLVILVLHPEKSLPEKFLARILGLGVVFNPLWRKGKYCDRHLKQVNT